MAEENKKQNIVIYTDPKGNVELMADVQKETIWASLNQIAVLFDVKKAAVSKHLKNIFYSGELVHNSTVSKMETVQMERNRAVRRMIEYYNLDAIIAVGYRVNSKKATQFRIWATTVLRDYILKGVAVNANRVQRLPAELIDDLEQKVRFIQRTVRTRELLVRNEVDGLLSVVNGYSNSWRMLLEYDEGRLLPKLPKTNKKTWLKTKDKPKESPKELRRFDYDFVRPAVDELARSLLDKDEASDLFGRERDESFKGILRTVYQTFDHKELYVSLEEKAAHLLYFIIKDHPFSDGNKRIGSFVFIYFLDRNNMLYRVGTGGSGEKKIDDNMLVALALLVAESDPKDKNTMVALITHVIS
jgi:prophage maintenance system killer protein